MQTKFRIQDSAFKTALRVLATLIVGIAAWGIYGLLGLLPHWAQFDLRAGYVVGAMTFLAAIVIIAIWSGRE